MNLCIDTGNSRTKVGIFENNKMIYFQEKSHFFINELYQICEKFGINVCILSSTSQKDIDLQQTFTKHALRFMEFTNQTPVPLTNLYRTPETLGNDRLAAAVGANFLQPKTDILIIDAGTAITFDFLDSARNYHGGTISPGIEMRFRALHEFTGRLPLVEISENKEITLTGNDTHSAIYAGVLNGVLFETEQYIEQYKEKFPSLAVFLTGGNGIFLEKRLKCCTFAEKFLVLIGLNQILEYNKNIIF